MFLVNCSLGILKYNSSFSSWPLTTYFSYFLFFWFLIVLISFLFEFIIIFIILIAHFPQRFSMVRITLLNLLFSTCRIVESSWWNLRIPFVLILTDNGDWRLWCLWNWFYFSFANPLLIMIFLGISNLFGRAILARTSSYSINLVRCKIKLKSGNLFLAVFGSLDYF